ncbi:beta-agarase [Echinicola strongylocentroti]|uniref:Beta-agarase n=1 Tax=Echinicola strongylocentroti TaxID=1795355 RepID=A0A2Z4IQG5_9BACT|nr:family 16 glycosylhydrolase [Echinicola strongylocentroti]AWW33054.1 beta-agarase [Echinicola strongylocentroti]
MKHSILFVLSCCLWACSATEDPDIPPKDTDPLEGYTYENLPVVNTDGFLPPDKSWEFVEDFSDEFDYSGKEDGFFQKWNDTYFNAWMGPGLTEWNTENSTVSNGNLVLSASRKPGTEQVYCGVISSKTTIQYPIYTEVRAKVANQVLSSNFWFLSEDDTREIDVVEIYGSDRPDQSWFAARPSTNYHVFVRDDNNNILQNFNDQQHHPLPDESPYRNDYHLFGAYWKDPFSIDFYYDGKLVRQLRKEGLEDPSGEGLEREMFMIIDLEDHEWRSFPANDADPIRATDEELADESKNKYLVDYVRTFRPLDSFDGGLISNGSFSDPSLVNWYWKGDIKISHQLDQNDGDAKALQLTGKNTGIAQKVNLQKDTAYQLSFRANFSGQLEIAIPGVIQKSISGSGKWQSYQLEFNSTDNTEITLLITQIENPGTSFLDDVILSKK